MLLDHSRLLALAAAACLGAAVLATGAGAPADQVFGNLRDRLRTHPASGEIQIVEIDARSLAAISRWPWPRSVHAAIVDRLVAAGARSIAFDVDFSSASDPADDARLATALRRAGGKVILSAFRQQVSGNASDMIDTLPLKQLRSDAFIADVNVSPDASGNVQELPLGAEVGGIARPSMASMLAERTARIGRSFDLDGSIDPATIPRYSAIDVIAGSIPAVAIRGKRILIGATAVEMGDRYAVPGHGVIPGAVIQAMAAETLLEGPLPQHWSGLALLVLASVGIAVSVRMRKRVLRIAVLVATVGAVFGLPFAAIGWFAVTLPIAPAFAALLAAALVNGAATVAERFRERALKDAHSGLPNLAAMQAAVPRSSQCFLVVGRIERFADIAAGLGPQMTATLVNRIADRLRFGAGGEQQVYRTDETSLAWIEAGTGSELEHRIDTLVTLMRAPVECGRLIDASLCFGVSPVETLDVPQAVANAALAAQKAAQGGHRWAIFRQSDGDAVNRELMLLGELDQAMQSGQIWNAYQPKLDIASGLIAGAEALVRWLHPHFGPIGPDSFIPLIEKTGRMRDLTLHVLRQALDDALDWDAAGHAMGVGINVSAQLLTDHAFIELIGETLVSHPLPTERVTIEVTESAAMASPDRAIAALEGWRALGVHISIDDYGTGQSSLGYLQKLPASELKIDKSFVQTVGSDPRNKAMVRSTIDLAHQLGMTVVAEGVEDASCLAVLADLACDKAQGFHIGRPVHSGELIDLLRRNLARAA